MTLVVLAGFALGGCGGDDSAGDPSELGAQAESSSGEPKSSKPKVEVPKGPPPKKLVKNDLEVGSGPAAKTGDQVNVHYVLVDYTDGKEVEASWDQGEPLSFELGSGQVIQGWEEGVAGMKEGGRRELIVPSKLAYGKGALIFVVDLLSIGPSPEEEEAERENPRPTIEVPKKPPPKELVVRDLEEGSGEEAKAGSEIEVEYVAVSYQTGDEFEAVWGEPSAWQLGAGEVIEGWEQGLKGMKAGGRRELIIPSRLAFKQGPVIYVVEMVDVK